MTKIELRRLLRARRAALAPAERKQAALRAAARLLRTPWLARARHVALYMEAGSELATWPLLDALWRRGVQVYVPKLRSDSAMIFVRMDRMTPLRWNRHGIAEPAGRVLRSGVKHMDAIVLPLLGFDAQGNRLGSGAGYYDRALASARDGRKPILIGYAYALQEVATLPTEPWDVKLDAVITEKGVRRWPTG